MLLLEQIQFAQPQNNLLSKIKQCKTQYLPFENDQELEVQNVHVNPTIYFYNIGRSFWVDYPLWLSKF